MSTTHDLKLATMPHAESAASAHAAAATSSGTPYGNRICSQHPNHPATVDRSSSLSIARCPRSFVGYRSTIPLVGWLSERFDGPGCEHDADMIITGDGCRVEFAYHIFAASCVPAGEN